MRKWHLARAAAWARVENAAEAVAEFAADRRIRAKQKAAKAAKAAMDKAAMWWRRPR